MLREVKNKHIKPRIAPFQLTTTASGVTLNQGYGDFTATRTGVGAGVLTLPDDYARNALWFASQSTAAGAYPALTTSTSNKQTFGYSLLDTSGSALEGSVEGFTLGWDSSDANLVKTQRVACTAIAPRIIWGKINGTTGAVSIGLSDFSVTRTATGTYTIVFRNAFGKTPVILITPISTSTGRSHFIVSKTANGCSLRIGNASGTDTDSDFYITAIGSDSRSDAAKNRMPLENSQRKPRILGFQITNTAGTPTLTIGGLTGGADFASLTDNGAGDFSLTISEAFAREPAIHLSTTTQRVQVHSFASNIIRLLTKNASGTNTDVTGVTSGFVIGTDDAGEY